MELPLYRPPMRDGGGTLWRVSTFGRRQRTAAGTRYWWRNAGREPAGLVVVQATLAGSVELHEGEQVTPVRSGSLMLFVYDEPSAYGLREPLAETYVCSWVCLQGAGLREHVEALRRRFGSVRDVGLDHPLFAELDELVALAEPKSATPPTAMAAATHAFVMRLFDQAEESRRRTAPPVQQAIDFVVRQPHLVASLDAVAERFGCAREHLSRTFADQVGGSAAGYVAQAKQRRALRLLQDTDLPLGDVAQQAGFATGRTMARQVRAATGMTPSAYREARGRS